MVTGRVLSRAYVWLFPERQFYLRSRGRVRYVALPGRIQAGLALVLVAMLGWIAFASADFAIRQRTLAAMNLRIAGLESSRQAITDELRSTRLRFIAVVGELETKHNLLVALLREKTDLEHRLEALNEELHRTTEERDAASLDSEQLGRDLLDQQADLTARIAALEQSLTSSRLSRSNLETDLTGSRNRVARVNAERDVLMLAQDELTSRLNQVMLRLESLRGEQQVFVARILSRTDGEIGSLEATVAMTGLDIEAILGRTENGDDVAQGGPFTTLSVAPDFLRPDWGYSAEFEFSVLELENRLERWEALQSVVQVLPLAAPADNYYISSRFGRRRDPINGRWAFHAGVDMAGPARTAIRATAPGTVLGVRSSGPYGKSILLDHGMGVQTRYGHLNQILVETGQAVGFREKIGRMGSTGRSTGTHLHYEILFDGTPLDPDNFINAGTYVFKN